MMNQTFVKPMSADYARHVVSSANRRHALAADSKLGARSFSLFQARRRSSAATSVATAAGDFSAGAADGDDENTRDADTDGSDSGADSRTADARKKTWWRQLVLSQSLPAMMNVRATR